MRRTGSPKHRGASRAGLMSFAGQRDGTKAGMDGRDQVIQLEEKAFFHTAYTQMVSEEMIETHRSGLFAK